jgi:hypothetical protein
VCVSADGVPRCQPLLIFRGAVKGDVRRKDEERKYAHGVDVLWNPKAYCNEDTMLFWIKHMYQFSSAYSTLSVEREPRLLSLDAFLPHLTPAVSCALKAQKVTISVVPGGCTGMVQVLDVSLNKPLKDLIQEEQDNYYNTYIDEWQQEKFNVEERRILLTHWVARAWKRLYSEYKETIIKTFQAVGLSLNPDGSQDKELLRVKGIPDISVGNYQRDDSLSQGEEGNKAFDLAVAAAAQDKEEVWDAVAESNSDEDRDLRLDSPTSVTQLLRPLSERTKRMPARDRYFLSQEAEAGDPLCVEDAADATTDTEDHGDEAWDKDSSDDEFDPDKEVENYEMVQQDYYMI